MIRALRLPAFALSLLLAACEATTDRSAGGAGAAPVPVAFRIALDGDTAPVLAEDGSADLVLKRGGADEPVTLGFGNDALAVHPLAPGRYEVASLGSLQCRGLAFEVGDRPRYLGTLRARVVRTDYIVAMMQPSIAVPADVAAFAERAGSAVDAVDARPIPVAEPAPCFFNPGGNGVTWEDLTLGEKILLSVGVAGLCAVALVSGGFCHF